MFEQLSQRLSQVTRQLTGRGRLSEDNIKDAVRQVRVALLEADVALPVAQSFVARVKDRALDTEVSRSLSPGQVFIKIIRDELTVALGAEAVGLSLRAQPPVVVLMAGLQGSGKTTTTAKLARRLKDQDGRAVAVVSLDTYRPAAITQLERLAEQVGVACYPSDPADSAGNIASAALERARREQIDVLLLDSAGRLHIDEVMMQELSLVCVAVSPHETLFVLDSMAGQDAVNAARSFADQLSLTGIVLTKIDGDARGGAALSVREVVGQPIKFVGSGEKLDALEPFYPERMASRILGMGDVVGLVEEVETRVDRAKAERLGAKLKRGKAFDLNDLAEQLEQMSAMGGLASLLEKLPGMGAAQARLAQGQLDERQVRRQIALIRSMTPSERRFPKTINGSRKRRIATGAGLAVPDLNRLLKQYTQMSKMMRKMAKRGGLQQLMRSIQAGSDPRQR